MSSETKALVGILLATIIIIIGGAFLAGRGGSKPDTPGAHPELLVRSDDPVLGPADAKVTVVEFGDFECPSCGAVHPMLKELKAKNKDASVRFVFRNFPLSQHEHAALAAEAALEAQHQGKFWEYHDLMFEHQTALTRADLEQYAKQVGLDVEAFKKALDDHTLRAAVDQDRSDGEALSVSSTPTIFINAVQYTGPFSVSGLQAAVDAALGK